MAIKIDHLNASEKLISGLATRIANDLPAKRLAQVGELFRSVKYDIQDENRKFAELIGEAQKENGHSVLGWNENHYLAEATRAIDLRLDYEGEWQKVQEIFDGLSAILKKRKESLTKIYWNLFELLKHKFINLQVRLS